MRVDFTEKFTENQITKFIEINKYPIILEFDTDNIELLFKNMNPAIFLFSSDYQTHEETFISLSKEFKGLIYFCKADLNSPDSKRLSDFFGVIPEEQPASVIVQPKDNLKKLRLLSDITKENLWNFINDWKENKLIPYLRSEKIPKNEYENDVRIVVGENFNEIIMDPEKDALVMFYAPWCQHSKKLLPHFELLAQGFKSFQNIIIAKIDANLNEVSGVEIIRYPTLLFYPGANKTGIAVEKRLDYESLLEFMRENANLKVKDKGLSKFFEEQELIYKENQKKKIENEHDTKEKIEL